MKEVDSSQKLIEDESHDEVDGMEVSPPTRSCRERKNGTTTLS